MAWKCVHETRRQIHKKHGFVNITYFYINLLNVYYAEYTFSQSGSIHKYVWHVLSRKSVFHIHLTLSLTFWITVKASEIFYAYLIGISSETPTH